MNMQGDAALRQLALRVLAQHAGPAAGAEAIAAAAGRAYDDLARVLATVIGEAGANALADRALHLAKSEYPWLAPTREPAYAEMKFSQIIAPLARQDPAVGAAAAAAVLAAFLGLLATFIGEPLAARLWRQAWPDVFQRNAEET